MSGRIRTIKPELLEDAVTAGLSETAFRLFVGMLLLADDYGVLRAEPGFLHGQIFWKRPPSIPIENALAEVCAKLVLTYEHGGQSYAFIRNWEKHQKVSHRGKRRLPPPPETLEKTSGESPEIFRPDLRPATSDQRPSTTRAPEAPRESGETPGSESPREQDYQRAYELGASKALGRPFAMPEKQRPELHQALLTFAKDPKTGAALRGERVLRWIAFQAGELVRVAQASGDDPKFWSGYGPRGMLRMLNELPTEPARDARAPPPRDPESGVQVVGGIWEPRRVSDA